VTFLVVSSAFANLSAQLCWLSVWKLSKPDQAITLVTILETPGSNLDLDTDCPD
jgi:hypothetical protein